MMPLKRAEPVTTGASVSPRRDTVSAGRPPCKMSAESDSTPPLGAAGPSWTIISGSSHVLNQKNSPWSSLRKGLVRLTSMIVGPAASGGSSRRSGVSRCRVQEKKSFSRGRLRVRVDELSFRALCGAGGWLPLEFSGDGCCGGGPRAKSDSTGGRGAGRAPGADAPLLLSSMSRTSDSISWLKRELSSFSRSSTRESRLSKDTLWSSSV
mmetsp:Transcript_13321/g.45198  ORF Transcript_13321/g.45198 Transcript_13321/m.45198 type:complete len:209 (-) Transcript_13321:78-704(-)